MAGLAGLVPGAAPGSPGGPGGPPAVPGTTPGQCLSCLLHHLQEAITSLPLAATDAELPAGTPGAPPVPVPGAPPGAPGGPGGPPASPAGTVLGAAPGSPGGPGRATCSPRRDSRSATFSPASISAWCWMCPVKCSELAIAAALACWKAPMAAGVAEHACPAVCIKPSLPHACMLAGTPGAPPITGLAPGTVAGAAPGSPGGPGGPPAVPGTTPGQCLPTDHCNGQGLLHHMPEAIPSLPCSC